jgi:hypothetical protein
MGCHDPRSTSLRAGSPLRSPRGSGQAGIEDGVKNGRGKPRPYKPTGRRARDGPRPLQKTKDAGLPDPDQGRRGKRQPSGPPQIGGKPAATRAKKEGAACCAPQAKEMGIVGTARGVATGGFLP